MSPEDRAWEMAGLARKDGDKAAEQRYTDEARSYRDQLYVRKLRVSVTCPSCRVPNNTHGMNLKFLRCGGCGHSFAELAL